MAIALYGFEDAEGNPQTFTTFNASEAREYAQKYGLRWIVNIYEWQDSDLVEDFTSRVGRSPGRGVR